MWHLRTWFRGVHSGGRLMLDSVSLEVFSNLNNPVLTQISIRVIPFLSAGVQRKWSLLRACVKRKTWSGNTLRKQTNYPCLLSYYKGVFNKPTVFNKHSLLSLESTTHNDWCQRAQKSGNYNLACLRTPGKKEKISRSSSQLWQNKPWISSGWASTPTHSHLSSSISITV